MFWQIFQSKARGLLGREEAGGDRAAKSGSDPNAGDAQRGDLSIFERRVKSLIEKNGNVSAGSLQVLGLDELRKELGDRFEKQQNVLHDIISRTIQEHLTRADVFTRLHGLNYAIVFGSLGKRAGNAKVEILKEKILQKIKGEEAGGLSLTVEAELFELGADAVGLGFGASGRKGGPGDSEGNSEADPASRKPRKRKPGKGADTSVWDAMAGVNEGDEPDSGHRRAAESDASGLSALEALGEEAEADATPTQMPLREEPVLPEAIEFVYRPLWYVQKNVISNYLCMPIHRTPHRTLQWGYQIVPDPPLERLVYELDMKALAHVAEAMRDSASSGQPLLLSCPIHFDTLANARHRNDFLSHAAKLAQSDRHFLLFELCGITQNVPSGRLAEFVQILKTRGRAVLARIALNHKLIPMFKGTGTLAVGAAGGTSPENEPYAFREMEQFAKAARLNGLQTYLHGLPTLSLTTAAVCAGIDYVHSDRIAPYLSEPRGLVPFEPTQLFRNLTE